MRIKFLILLLLCFNIVIAQVYPNSVPPEFVTAGATQEFLDIYCLMSQYHVQRFVIGVDAVKNYFANISNDLNLTISLSEIDPLRESINEAINSVCNANETNFVEKIESLMDLLQGSEGLEPILRGIGGQFEVELNAKRDEFDAEKDEIDAEKALIDAEAAGLTGSLTLEEHAALNTQLGSINNEISVLVAQAESAESPEEVNSLLTQIDAKRLELDAVAGQLQAAAGEADDLEDQANQLRERAEQLMVDAESFRIRAESYGAKAESLFSDIENQVKSRLLDQGQNASLLAEVNQKQQALFNKIMDYQSSVIDKHEAELEAHGIKVQGFSELKSYLNSKRSQAMSLLTGEVDPEVINSLTSEVEAQALVYRNQIIDEATNKVVNAFFPEFTELEARLDEGLEKAKALGYDTIELETKIVELKAFKESAQELAEQGNVNGAFALIEDIKLLFDEVESIYHSLKAQGEETRDMVEEFISEVESIIPVIAEGVEQAGDAGLDLYGLDFLLAELRAHGDAAESAFSNGDLAIALSHVDKARNTYEAIKVAWDKLRGVA